MHVTIWNQKELTPISWFVCNKYGNLCQARARYSSNLIYLVKMWYHAHLCGRFVFNESIHTSVGSPVWSNDNIITHFNFVEETIVVLGGRLQMQRVSYLRERG